MERKQISRDDIQDVQDLAKEMLLAIGKILEDQDTNIALSASVSAIISLIIANSTDMSELLHNRNVLYSFFDSAIKEIQVKMSGIMQDWKKDLDQEV